MGGKKQNQPSPTPQPRPTWKKWGVAGVLGWQKGRERPRDLQLPSPSYHRLHHVAPKPGTPARSLATLPKPSPPHHPKPRGAQPSESWVGSPAWTLLRPDQGLEAGVRPPPRRLGGSEERPGDLSSDHTRGWYSGGRGLRGAVIPFRPGLGKRARERPRQQPRYLTGPVGPPGRRRRRRGHSRPEGWGPQQGRKGGGRREGGDYGQRRRHVSAFFLWILTAPPDRGPFPTTHPSRSLIHGPVHPPAARSPAVFTN